MPGDAAVIMVSERLARRRHAKLITRRSFFDFTGQDLSWAYCFRASEASYFDTDGLLKWAPANKLRIERDPGTLERFALIEPESTNIVTWSEDLNQSPWLGSNATIAANLSVAPDGKTAMEALRDTTANSNHNVQAAYGTITTGQTWTISSFLKSGSHSVAQITLSTTRFSAGYYANFRMSDGTIQNNLAAAGKTIRNAGGGIYRGSVTGTASSSGSSTTTFVYAMINNNGSLSRLSTYVGANNGFFAWGAQMELAAEPTSYIRTAGAAATRKADRVLIDLSGWDWPVTLRAKKAALNSDVFADVDYPNVIPSSIFDLSALVGSCRLKSVTVL